jgi:hypothetical protein
MGIMDCVPRCAADEIDVIASLLRDDGRAFSRVQLYHPHCARCCKTTSASQA